MSGPLPWKGLKLTVEVTIPEAEFYGEENSLEAMMKLAEKLSAAGIPAGVNQYDPKLSLAVYDPYTPVKYSTDGVAVEYGTLARVYNFKENTVTFSWTP